MDRFSGTSRRRFLEGGIGTGLSSLLGRDSPEETIDDIQTDVGTQQSEEAVTITGRVVDLDGEPVAGAEVTCHDLFTTQTLGGAMTDDDGGRFHLDIQNSATPFDIYLVASAADENERMWFHVESTSLEESDDSLDTGELQLTRQLLTEPLEAYADDSDSIYSVVSVWRWISPDYPTNQIIYIEFTGTAPEAPRDPEIDPWNITYLPELEEPGPDRLRSSLLSRVLPKVVVPQDSVYVAFDDRDRLSSQPFPGAPNKVHILRNEHHHNDERDELFLESWHPLKQPSLPAFAFSRGRADALQYNRHTEPGVDEDEVLQEAMWRTLTTLPFGVGSVFSLIETLQWASDLWFGDEEGPRSTNLLSEVPQPNRNHQNVAMEAWEGEASSVVFQVPLRFRPDYIDDKTVNIIVDATWEITGGGVARFAEQFSLGSEPPAIGSDRDSETDVADPDSVFSWIPTPTVLDWERLRFTKVNVADLLQLDDYVIQYPFTGIVLSAIGNLLDLGLVNDIEEVNSFIRLNSPEIPRGTVAFGEFTSDSFQPEEFAQVTEYGGFTIHGSENAAFGVRDDIVISIIGGENRDENAGQVERIIQTAIGDEQRLFEQNTDYTDVIDELGENPYVTSLPMRDLDGFSVGGYAISAETENQQGVILATFIAILTDEDLLEGVSDAAIIEAITGRLRDNINNPSVEIDGRILYVEGELDLDEDQAIE